MFSYVQNLCQLLLIFQSEVQSWLYLLFPLTLVILFVGVFDFYIEGLAISHLQPMKTALLTPIAIFSTAIFLSLTWTHPYVTSVTSMHKLSEIITEDHVLSAGVIFSALAFLLGTFFFLIIHFYSSLKRKFIFLAHFNKAILCSFPRPL